MADFPAERVTASRPMQLEQGRIMEVFTGNDDLVKVIKVKTSSGELVRAIVRLRKLPVDIPVSPSSQRALPSSSVAIFKHNIYRNPETTIFPIFGQVLLPNHK